MPNGIPRYVRCYDNGDDEDFQNFKDQATKELTDAVEGALKDYLFKPAFRAGCWLDRIVRRRP